MQCLCPKLAQCNEYLASNVAKEYGWMEDISSHSAEYASMRFQLFMR